MDTKKTAYTKAFCGLAVSLEHAQRMAAPLYKKEHPERSKIKDEFIGPMWMDPAEHRKMMEEEKNGIHQ